MYGWYQLTQLYLRAGFSLPTQASFFLICMGDSVGMDYCPCVMPKPEKWLCNKGRQQDWIPDMFLWVEPTYFWSYPYSPKPYFMYWLNFTNQPNIVIDSGMHPSLHSNCHHQIVFSKLNLKFKYSRFYEWLVWNYKNYRFTISQWSNWNAKLGKVIPKKKIFKINLNFQWNNIQYCQ